MVNFPFIDSAELAQFRQFLDSAPQWKAMVGEPLQLSVVLDANMAVNDLIHKFKKPQYGQTALEECVRSSALKIYAPTWLDAEMTNSTIPQVALRRNIPENVLQEMWREYRHLINWDDNFPDADEFVEVDGDAKDMPYVALQHSIQGVGILTRDQGVKQLGGKPIELEFVFCVRRYARAASYSVGIRLSGAFVGWAGVNGVTALVKGVGQLVAKMPDWLKYAVLIGVVLAVLHPGFRQRVLNHLRSIKDLGVEIWPEIQSLITLATEKQTEAEKALANLDEVLRA